MENDGVDVNDVLSTVVDYFNPEKGYGEEIKKSRPVFKPVIKTDEFLVSFCCRFGLRM